MKPTEFDDLVGSVKQAGKIRRGELEASRRFQFRPVDIKSIRSRLGLSQAGFALMIGVSVATLQNWEQGRRTPEGPARALLRVVEQKPEAVLEALAT
jgi:putative transcriptional regulator